MGYYDPMNFAPDIHCPVLMNAGLVDPVSLPTGVWAVFNRLAAAKRRMVVLDGLAHDWSAEFDRQAWRWLDEVLPAGPAAPPAGTTSSGKPVFQVLSVAPLPEADVYPAGTVKLTFRSAHDGQADWALFTPGDRARRTVVYLHGSFSHADQIYTRQDMREFWLTRILAGRHPLLSINMRDTSYMSPPATRDLTDLLDHGAKAYGCRDYVLLGGSGGASSAMAYAVMHPERLAGVVAMGMCDIFARLEFARQSANAGLQELARVIVESYGGRPAEKPEIYRQRSVLAHADRLTMPVVLTMGEDDALIPVAETRKVAMALQHHPTFTYVEIPGGDHDSALWIDIDLDTLEVKDGRRETGLRIIGAAR